MEYEDTDEYKVLYEDKEVVFKKVKDSLKITYGHEYILQSKPKNKISFVLNSEDKSKTIE